MSLTAHYIAADLLTPQILNILRGDMSIVGPRPALHNKKELIVAREGLGIHQLRPGLTGWAQIHGRDDLSDQLKVQYDYHYLQQRSLKLDLEIILKTFLFVLQAKGVKMSEDIRQSEIRVKSN